MSTELEDKEYRKMVSDVFTKVTRAFDEVDPDLAEVEVGSGTCTILTPKNHSKLIISPQPPVRQIWLAAAALGIAAHFDWDKTKKLWIDDKGKGLELFSYCKELVKQTAGVDVKF